MFACVGGGTSKVFIFPHTVENISLWVRKYVSYFYKCILLNDKIKTYCLFIHPSIVYHRLFCTQGCTHAGACASDLGVKEEYILGKPPVY